MRVSKWGRDTAGGTLKSNRKRNARTPATREYRELNCAHHPASVVGKTAGDESLRIRIISSSDDFDLG